MNAVVILDMSKPAFDIFDSCAGTKLAFVLRFQLPTVFARPQDFGISRALVSGGSDMFRISTIDTQSERRLVVEGKLLEPWTAELRKAWEASSEDLNGRKRTIDISNVTTIGREGEDAIFELMRAGASFSCCGILMKHMLKQLAHKCTPGANKR